MALRKGSGQKVRPAEDLIPIVCREGRSGGLDADRRSGLGSKQLAAMFVCSFPNYPRWLAGIAVNLLEISEIGHGVMSASPGEWVGLLLPVYCL